MTTKFNTLNRLLLGSAAFVSSAIGTTQLAQAQVDEIVVTATKREKSLQDVPVSVTALSPEALDNAAVTNLESLQFSVPGLSMTTAAGSGWQSSIRLRGVGTSGTNIGFEGSVGVFVDGTYRPRAGSAMSDMADVERIEVLRGPQGTLFGRNTTAGAISVITKKPVLNEASGELRATFGNLDRTQLRGIFNAPLVEDQLAGRLVVDYNQRDGFLENTIPGVDDFNDRDRVSVRGQLLYEPNPNMELRLLASYFTADEVCCGAVTVDEGPIVTAGNAGLLTGFGFNSPVAIGADRYGEFEIAANTESADSQEEFFVQGDFEWEFGNGITLFNSMSYSDYDFVSVANSDLTNLDYLNALQNDSSQQQFTNELRLSGSYDGVSFAESINWILGGYYSEEDITLDYELLFGADSAAISNFLAFAGAPGFPPFGFTPGDSQVADLDQNTEVFAGFGHLDIDINDQVNISGGARYTSEDKVGTGDFTTTTGALFNPFILPGASPFEADAGADEWIYTLALNYKWNSDISTYASYAHGYKSGGINLDVLGGQGGADAGSIRALVANGFGSFNAVAADPTFPIEDVDTFEIGLKSRLLDGLATFNLTGFHSTFDNFQLLQFTGTSFNIVAAPEVTTKGFESELVLSPVDGLNINAQYTYADASYTEDFILGGRQLGGQTINNAPKHSAAVNATYTHQLDNGLEGFVNGGWAYNSSQNTDAGLAPTRIQDAHSLFTGRVGIGSDDKLWGVELWCRNCTNELVNQIEFESPIPDGSELAFIYPSREWGVTLTSRF